MASELQDLVDWCHKLKEEQTIEHTRVIRQGRGYMTQVRHEMLGMRWTLGLVVEELKRRIKEQENG